MKFGNPLIYLIASITGSVFVLILGSFVDELAPRMVKKAISFLGMNSLIILGTHQFIMLVMHIPTHDVITLDVLLSIIIMIVEVPVIYLINKVKKYYSERKNDGERNTTNPTEMS